LNHVNEAVILNVNSGLGLSPKTNSAVYNATKGALNIFSQSLRYQLEDTNIIVQQVFLPLIDTQMTKGRGKNKMTAKNACYAILEGLTKGILDHDIGKVKMLRLLLRIAPSMAQKIMKKI
jgi:short-subunit dehydrogenase involved in D-alanine esterification of teichoic acids